jgi:FKBP-type peptidyl-prolyl cis-trans isomerase SlpA
MVDAPTVPRIAAGSHVTLHYRLAAIAAGEARDIVSTFGAQPATLTVGRGELAPTLEACLVGLEEGAQREFSLDAGAAFGSRSPDLVQTLTRTVFEAESEPGTDYAPGDVVRFARADGNAFGGVLKSIDAERVTVDFNHPLAGLPVQFEVHVIGVL